MRQHDLKCGALYFNDVRTGVKPFELRYNDRDFHVGDLLVLHEMNDDGPTGVFCTKRITYVLEGLPWLMAGYCALGLCDA